MLLDVVGRVLDGLDLLRVLIRNLDVEGLFELHHQFDDVERIGAEVFLEACTGRDLSFVHLKLLDDNLFHLLIYCCHCSNLLWIPSESRGLRMRPETTVPATASVCKDT